jgi:hypothetical protein
MYIYTYIERDTFKIYIERDFSLYICIYAHMYMYIRAYMCSCVHLSCRSSLHEGKHAIFDLLSLTYFAYHDVL